MPQRNPKAPQNFSFHLPPMSSSPPQQRGRQHLNTITAGLSELHIQHTPQQQNQQTTQQDAQNIGRPRTNSLHRYRPEPLQSANSVTNGTSSGITLRSSQQAPQNTLTTRPTILDFTTSPLPVSSPVVQSKFVIEDAEYVTVASAHAMPPQIMSQQADELSTITAPTPALYTPKHPLLGVVPDGDFSPLSPPAITPSSQSGPTIHPLILACATNNLDAVKHIISNELATGSFKPDAPRQQQTGYTPLMCAVAVGSLPIVQLLVAHGANVNFVTDDSMSRWTPLMKACDSGWLNIVQFLLEKGARIRHMNKHGENCLSRACLHGHVEIVRYLIAHRANIDLTDHLGATPLMWACLNGHLHVVSILLDHGAKVNHTDINLETPLIFAVSNHHTFTVKLLLERGKADPNMVNKDGESPLMEAAANGFTDIVELLLDAGATVHLQNKDNLSALHKAASRGHFLTVRALVERGAPVYHENGPSPIDLARNYPEIVSYLNSAMLLQDDMMRKKAHEQLEQQLAPPTMIQNDWSTHQQLVQLQLHNEQLQSQLRDLQQQQQQQMRNNNS